jgi:hypothetical protein
LFGQRPAGVFVLVKGTGLVAVLDGVGEDASGDGRVVKREVEAHAAGGGKRVSGVADQDGNVLASQQAVREAEAQIEALLGARQYQQLRRNLARIAQLDLPPATNPAG